MSNNNDHNHDRAALRAQLAALPKIELHRHLEGSLRLSTLAELAHLHQLDVPAHDIDGLRPHVQMIGTGDFLEFLSKFPVLRQFYRSPETIRRFTYEAVEDAVLDNVRYLELRFNPVALAQLRDFPLDEVSDWVIAAVREAEDSFPIQVRLIVTINRMEVDLAPKVLQVALDRMDQGVVGLDLAGDEVNYPAEPFADLFLEARKAGLGITVHAGEWSGAENVRYAIEDLQATRIGHGVRVIENSDITQLALERRAVLEVCVTSNVQTGVVGGVSQHPLRDLYNLRMYVTLNTDDPAISGITLTDEYEVAYEHLEMGIAQLKKMNLIAAEYAFMPIDERTALVNRLREEYELVPET